MTDSGNVNPRLPTTPPIASTSDLPQADPRMELCLESDLIQTLQQMEALMDHAVKLAARVGPEWENVVVEVQTTLLDSLVELEKRLHHRLEIAGDARGQGSTRRTDGSVDERS